MSKDGAIVKETPDVQGTTNMYMQILVYIIQSIGGLKFVLVFAYRK